MFVKFKEKRHYLLPLIFRFCFNFLTRKFGSAWTFAGLQVVSWRSNSPPVKYLYSNLREFPRETGALLLFARVGYRVFWPNISQLPNCDCPPETEVPFIKLEASVPRTKSADKSQLCSAFSSRTLRNVTRSPVFFLLFQLPNNSSQSFRKETRQSA